MKDADPLERVTIEKQCGCSWPAAGGPQTSTCEAHEDGHPHHNGERTDEKRPPRRPGRR